MHSRQHSEQEGRAHACGASPTDHHAAAMHKRVLNGFNVLADNWVYSAHGATNTPTPGQASRAKIVKAAPFHLCLNNMLATNTV